MHYTFRFLPAALAVWRVTHLITHEDGPWDVLARMRRSFAMSMISKLMSCFYCLSLWVAVPFAWFVTRVPVEMLVSWLALSGAAVLLERATGGSLNIELGDE
jgi:hypothetical protein